MLTTHKKPLTNFRFPFFPLIRRMFPLIRCQVHHLDPRAMYSITLEFVQLGSHRWKYLNGAWVAGGKSEPPPAQMQTFYIHPDSPNFGSHWTKEVVCFTKVKLTNKPTSVSGQVVLNSLHKYQPRIHIVRIDSQTLNNQLIESRLLLPPMGELSVPLDDSNGEEDCLSRSSRELCSSPSKSSCRSSDKIVTFTFPETQFIAVTAYQNEDVSFKERIWWDQSIIFHVLFFVVQQVTHLKIKYNPFAKAFQDIREKPNMSSYSTYTHSNSNGRNDGGTSPRPETSYNTHSIYPSPQFFSLSVNNALGTPTSDLGGSSVNEGNFDSLHQQQSFLGHFSGEPPPPPPSSSLSYSRSSPLTCCVTSPPPPPPPHPQPFTPYFSSATTPPSLHSSQAANSYSQPSPQQQFNRHFAQSPTSCSLSSSSPPLTTRGNSNFHPNHQQTSGVTPYYHHYYNLLSDYSSSYTNHPASPAVLSSSATATPTHLYTPSATCQALYTPNNVDSHTSVPPPFPTSSNSGVSTLTRLLTTPTLNNTDHQGSSASSSMIITNNQLPSEESNENNGKQSFKSKPSTKSKTSTNSATSKTSNKKLKRSLDTGE